MFLLSLLFLAGLAHANICPVFLDIDLVQIEKSNTRLSENKFFHERNLQRYENLLASQQIPTLTEFLQQLPDGAVFLDSGAGDALAIRDLIEKSSKLNLPFIQYLATSIVKPDFSNEYKKRNPGKQSPLDHDLEKYNNFFSYIDGGKIQDLVSDPKSNLYFYRESVDFITDLFGPLSYANDIQEIINTYADLLKVGGQALMLLNESSVTFKPAFKNKFQNTRLTFRELSFLIPMISGGRLEVVRADMQYEGYWPQFEKTVLWVRKVSQAVDKSIQGSPLQLIKFYDEAPPLRTYLVDFEGVDSLDYEKLRELDLQRVKTQFQYATVPERWLQ